MHVNGKVKLFLTQLLLILLFVGCQVPQGPVEIFLPAKPAGQQRSDAVANRFQESADQGPTVVESAMQLSKKYATLSEEMAMLQQRNQDLAVENRQLKGQVAAIGAQLQQTKEELTEANDLLQEMVVELNNWKANVLGFQKEMRDADMAQLEALLKILNILGGEVRTQSPPSEEVSSSALSPAEPARAQIKSRPAGKNLGESNG